MIISQVLDLLPPLAALLPQTIGPYAALMVIGFVVGILGHLTSARWLVAAGVILIFLGAFLFPLAVNLTTENKPPPIQTSP
jgi:sulfite exporter TauE/SafE